LRRGGLSLNCLAHDSIHLFGKRVDSFGEPNACRVYPVLTHVVFRAALRALRVADDVEPPQQFHHWDVQSGRERFVNDFCAILHTEMVWGVLTC
jgi:hypothetical protein